MDAIGKYLQDPAWWFSTVLIAIAASIFAGFTKDWLEKRFGFFLRWSATKRRQLKAEREELIAKWSNSEALLTLALLKMLYWLSVYLGLALALLIYVTYLRLKFGFVGVGSVEGLSPQEILSLASGVVLFSFYSFKVVRIVFVSVDMLAAFRKSRGLPPFAE